MTETPIGRVLAKLAGVTGRKPQWSARCPSHDDKRASLSIRENPDGQVLLKCQTGCTFEDVIGALGLKPGDLFLPTPHYSGKNGASPRLDEIARYDYTDEAGKPLFQKRRYLPKTFLLFRWESGDWKPRLEDTRRVLYRLAEVLAAAKAGRIVFLVEGEKDADNLSALGFCATTNYEGASKDTQKPKWREDYSNALRGAKLVIIPDNDDTGRAHATNAANATYGLAESVRILELPGLPDKGDVSDWLADGGDADKLKKMVGDTPVWEPSAAPITERESAIRSLREILADPETLSGPEEVVPRLAWRGRVTLLSGREKLGKSTLASAAAAAVSCGGTFIGQDVEAGPVLIVGLEEHVSDLAGRLNDFEADHDRLFVLDTLPPGKHIEAIEEAVRDIVAEKGEPPRLIVVDTLPRFAEDLVTDGGSAAQWGPVMSGLTKVARTANAALILLHHARKSDGKYRDSTAVGAGVDAIIEMDQNPQDDEAARKFSSKARWRTSDFTLRLAGNRYESLNGALSLETQVVFFIQANPGCSLSSVRKGVTARNAEIDALLKKLCGNKAIRDQGVAPNHSYYAVNDRADRDRVPGRVPQSELSPLGPTTDRDGTGEGQGGLSQIQTPSSEIGTGVQPETEADDWPVLQ